MVYYTFKVEEHEEDGQKVFHVMEYDVDGVGYGSISSHANEVDAIIAAYFQNAWEKTRNYDMASIATAKYILKTGLRPVNVHIKHFDNATGQYDPGAMWNYLWESANG
jgi:hypothetical protein